jgi:hypothetical protein
LFLSIYTFTHCIAKIQRVLYVALHVAMHSRFIALLALPEPDSLSFDSHPIESLGPGKSFQPVECSASHILCCIVVMIPVQTTGGVQAALSIVFLRSAAVPSVAVHVSSFG